MAFLTKSDFNSSIYVEILDAITRSDDTIVTVAIDTAIAEMKGYLTARYQTDVIFATTGSSRHPLVLEFAKDIAIYHLHCIHDPVKIPDIRVKRYDRAIEWLKQVNKQMINPDLLLKEDTGNGEKYVGYGSNEKRENHF